MAEQYVLGIDFSASQNVFFLAERETGRIVYSKKVEQGAFYCYGKEAEAEIARRKESGKLPNDWKPPRDVPLEDLRTIDMAYLDSPRHERAANFIYDRAVLFLHEAKEKGGIPNAFSVNEIGLSIAGKVFDKGDEDGLVKFLGGNTPKRFGTDIGGGQIVIDGTSPFKVPVELAPGAPPLSVGLFKDAKIRGGNDCNTTGMAISKVYQTQGYDPKRTYYITISTGLGGGGPLDNVDEVGHHSVSMPLCAQIKCGCGKMDCVEAYACGTGIAKFARKMVELADDKTNFQEFTIHERAQGYKIDQRTVRDSKLAKAIKGGKEVKSKDVFEALEEGDKLAEYIVDRSSSIMANLIISLAMDYDLQVVGIGGGVGQNQKKFVDRIQAKVDKNLEGCQLLGKVKVEQNPLGKAANSYGALAPVIPEEHAAKWAETMVEEAEKVRREDRETLQRLQIDAPATPTSRQTLDRPRRKV